MTSLAKLVRNLDPALFEKVRLGEMKLAAAVRAVKPKHKPRPPKSETDQNPEADAGSEAAGTAGNGTHSQDDESSTVEECLKKTESLYDDLWTLWVTTMETHPRIYSELSSSFQYFVKQIETELEAAAKRCQE